jgi:uncharacterized protein (TIGR00297 family)
VLPPSPASATSRKPTRAASYQSLAVIIGFAPAAYILYFGPRLPIGNIALSASISALFALFAWLLGGVNASGALAGFAVAFTLYIAGGSLEGGSRAFAVLLFVFVLTWAATRAGRRRKAARGLVEERGGRDGAQVIANVGLAAYALLLPLPPVALCCAVAVLAEAAADTCSSELGKAFGGKTVLITNGRAVAPGTDGGVSSLGIIAAVVVGAAVCLLAAALGVLPHGAAARVTIAAVLATFLDSLLGATLERRGWLNNDAVNLLSTAAAAFFALVLCLY